MRRLARRFGGLAAGTSVGGLVVGLAEAIYRDAPPGYAMLAYGALWAAAGSFLAVVAAIGSRRARDSRARRLFVSGLALSLGVSSVVLVSFVVRRDVLHEAPGDAWMALLAGVATAVATVAPVWAGSRFIQRRIQWEQLGGSWLWILPLALIAAFGLRSRLAGDAFPETAPAAKATLADRGVILVVVDALRADALGVHGATLHRDAPPTPVIDAFARGGRLFTRAHAQASWTRPAVASILTSRHASGHGTMAKGAVLPDALPTLAGVLAGAGVHTAAVVTNYNLEPAYGFARGFDEYRYLAPARYLGAPEGASRLAAYNVYRLARERLFTHRREARYFYRSAQAVNAQALALLDAVGNGAFFLYLHYMEPHDPYFAVTGESYARVSTPRPPAAWADAMRVAYRDEVARFDRAFGELLLGLRARGLTERTTVILTADHGEEFAEHGGFFHGTTLYQEQLHIPLVIAGPGVAPAVDPRLARQVDLAPTVAARLGLAPPASWEGGDLLDPAALQASSVAEQDHEGHVLRAISTGDEKLILANPENPRGLAPVELYDLARDPGERHPAASGPALPRLTAALDAVLAQARRGGATAGARRADTASDAELRALGYVQ